MQWSSRGVCVEKDVCSLWTFPCPQLQFSVPFSWHRKSFPPSIPYHLSFPVQKKGKVQVWSGEGVGSKKNGENTGSFLVRKLPSAGAHALKMGLVEKKKRKTAQDVSMRKHPGMLHLLNRVHYEQLKQGLMLKVILLFIDQHLSARDNNTNYLAHGCTFYIPMLSDGSILPAH